MSGGARNGLSPESRAMLMSGAAFSVSCLPTNLRNHRASVRDRDEREGLSRSKDMARIAWTLAGPSVFFEKFECQAALSAGRATGGILGEGGEECIL